MTPQIYLLILVVLAIVAVILIVIQARKSAKQDKQISAQLDIIQSYEEGVAFTVKQQEAVNATLESRIEGFKSEYLQGIESGKIPLPAQFGVQIRQANDRLDNELNASREAAAQATRELKQSRADNKSLALLGQQMHDRIITLEQQLSEMPSSVGASAGGAEGAKELRAMAARVQELSDMTNQLKDEKQELSSQFEDLQTELSNLKVSNDQLLTTLNAADQKLNDAPAGNASGKSEASTDTDELAILRQSCEIKDLALKEQSAEIDSLNERLKEATQNKDEDEDIRELTIQEQNEKIAKLTEDVSNAEVKISELSKELEEAQAKASNSGNAEATGIGSETMAKLTKYASVVNDLESKLAKSSEDLRLKAVALSTAKQELAAAKETITKLESEKAADATVGISTPAVSATPSSTPSSAIGNMVDAAQPPISKQEYEVLLAKKEKSASGGPSLSIMEATSLKKYDLWSKAHK